MDLKADIEGLLGIRDENPAIGSNVTRGIEDMLRNRRPFDKPTKNGNITSHSMYRNNKANLNSSKCTPVAQDIQEELNKNKSHHGHKKHRHSSHATHGNGHRPEQSRKHGSHTRNHGRE
jgi:hypothetical protein